MTTAPTGTRWYHRPVGILVLLFLVLGPLALPLLWRSPHFSRAMKIVLTLATVGATILYLVLAWETVQQRLQDLDVLEDVQ
jgi:hypothetical protein